MSEFTKEEEVRYQQVEDFRQEIEQLAFEILNHSDALLSNAVMGMNLMDNMISDLEISLEKSKHQLETLLANSNANEIQAGKVLYEHIYDMLNEIGNIMIKTYSLSEDNSRAAHQMEQMIARMNRWVTSIGQDKE